MGGYLYPIWNLPVGSRKGPDWPFGRLAGRLANGQKIDRWALRSTARSTVPDPESNCSLTGRPPGRPGLDPESNGRPSDRPSWYREQSSLPVDRVDRPGPFPDSRGSLAVDRPISLAACTFCARRSIGPVDRPLLRSTCPVDRQSASPA